MEHLLLKAAVTAATDQGIFEAVISTPTVDRDKDIVEASAMVNALAKWASIGKLVPLAWAHQDEVIGNVDPSTAGVNDEGEVTAKGWIDQSTSRGEEAWKLVKSGTLSFSFGYLIPDGGATKRPGGRFHIKELDVYEISVIPIAPANNDTRVLNFKAAEVAPEATDQPDTELQEVKARLDKLEKALENQKKKAEEADKEPKTVRSVDPQRQDARETAIRVLSKGIQPPQQVPEQPKPEPDMGPAELRKQSRDLIVQILSGGHQEEK